MKYLSMSIIALILPLIVISCSSEEEFKEESNITAIQIQSIENYGKKLDDLSIHFANTRSAILNASEAEIDSITNEQGEKAIKALLPLSNTLFEDLQISDKDFEDAIAELQAEGVDTTNLRIDALKCYSALALYDTYLFDTTLNKRIMTRADYLDYAGCIALGSSFKSLADFSTAGMAKFLAKKTIARAIPYIGWGWAIISAHECIKRLR